MGSERATRAKERKRRITKQDTPPIPQSSTNSTQSVKRSQSASEFQLFAATLRDASHCSTDAPKSASNRPATASTMALGNTSTPCTAPTQFHRPMNRGVWVQFPRRSMLPRRTRSGRDSAINATLNSLFSLRPDPKHMCEVFVGLGVD